MYVHREREVRISNQVHSETGRNRWRESGENALCTVMNLSQVPVEGKLWGLRLRPLLSSPLKTVERLFDGDRRRSSEIVPIDPTLSPCLAPTAR